MTLTWTEHQMPLEHPALMTLINQMELDLTVTTKAKCENTTVPTYINRECTQGPWYPVPNHPKRTTNALSHSHPSKCALAAVTKPLHTHTLQTTATTNHHTRVTTVIEWQVRWLPNKKSIHQVFRLPQILIPRPHHTHQAASRFRPVMSIIISAIWRTLKDHKVLWRMASIQK